MADDKKYPGSDAPSDEFAAQPDAGLNVSRKDRSEVTDNGWSDPLNDPLNDNATATANDSASKRTEDVALGFFTDRDDDSGPSFVDSDFSEDFPEPGNDPETADPGYASFANDLEDPLADWPAPDVPLNDLPEVRQQEVSRQEAIQTSAPLETPDAYSSNAAESEPDLDPVVDFTDDEGPQEFFAEFDEDGDAVLDDEVSNNNVVDRNDLSEVGDDDAPFETPQDRHSPDLGIPAAPNDEIALDVPSAMEKYSDPEVVAEPPEGEQAEAFYGEEEGFVEFVDDFLNDLDPPTGESPSVDLDVDVNEEVGGGSEDGFDMAVPAAATFAAGSIDKARSFESSTMNNVQTEAPEVLKANASTPPDTENSGFPLGMIAVVGVALLLLGIGGFGVMQQRGDLEAEIRELQAKLATTISPEDAEMERERQRQVQIQNESLNTELEALSAENAALTAKLAELEAVKADQVAKDLEREQAAAKAAAEQEALKGREALAKTSAATKASTTASSSSAAKSGVWFVNFGSYADKGIADRWANKLTVTDGEVTVQRATAAGKTLYRVRVVSLPNQDAAERVATSLERQYELPRLWVGKN